MFEPCGSSSSVVGAKTTSTPSDASSRSSSSGVRGYASNSADVREPQRVHEDRDDHDVGDLAGAVDEVDVAVVEGADRGDERDPGPVRRCGSGLGQSGAQPVDGADHPLIVAVGPPPDAGPRVGERVVDRRVRERREVRAGIRHAGLAQQRRRLPHDRARELGGDGDRLGVRGAILLGDHDRLAAELDGERLRDRAAPRPGAVTAA